MSDTKKLELSPSVSVIVAGVIIAAAIIFVGKFPAQAQPGAKDGAPTYTQVSVPAPSAQDHRYGAADAPVVLIEYSDFQCPYCQRIHPTLKRIVDESQGKVAWIYRHFPLESIHPQARPAALASECVAAQLGSDGFWKFANALFDDQQNLNAERYQTLAVSLGADAAQFASCVEDETFAARVEKESTDAQISGGSGTPYTIVYGAGMQVPLNGALPYEQIIAVIKALQERQ